MRVAQPDKLVLCKEEKAVGPLHVLQGVHDPLCRFDMRDWAMRWMITFAVHGRLKMEPYASSSAFNMPALTRLPLCAMASAAHGEIDEDGLDIDADAVARR